MHARLHVKDLFEGPKETAVQQPAALSVCSARLSRRQALLLSCHLDLGASLVCSNNATLLRTISFDAASSSVSTKVRRFCRAALGHSFDGASSLTQSSLSPSFRSTLFKADPES